MDMLNKCIRKPFEDLGKLSIGAVLLMLPLVNIITSIFVYGYMLRYANGAMRGKEKLPEWKKFGELFGRGLKGILANLLLALPALAVFGVLISLIRFDAVDCITGDCGSAISFAAPMQTIYILIAAALLLLVVIMYIAPAVQLLFAGDYSLREAFDIQEIARIVTRWDYCAAFLIYMGIAIVVSFVMAAAAELLSFTLVLPLAVAGYMMMINQIIYFTVFLEAAMGRKQA